MRKFPLFDVINLREKNAKISLSLEHYCNLSKSIAYPQTGQMFASLFPALGSPFETVLLGFTICGDYLVTLDSSSVRFHSISLSVSQISIRGLHFRLPQNVNLGQHDGLAWWSSPLEILMCNDGMQYIATLHFANPSSRFEFECPDEILSICDLRLFSSGKMLLSMSVFALLNESVLFKLTTQRGKEKTVLLINDGSYASFFFFIESDLNAEIIEIVEEIASSNLPHELQEVKTFSSAQGVEDHWFSCNIAPDISTEAIIVVVIPQSKFDFEQFLRNTLLPFYYPGLDVSKSLIAFEMRCLGPGETGFHILMVISAALAPNRFVRPGHGKSETKEIAYLIAMHPLLGDVSVLKIRDLGELYLSHCARAGNLGTEHACEMKQPKSLGMKTDLYCRQILQSDPFLGHFRSSFQLLSTVEASCHSLKYIAHPFLPLYVYNDEIS